MRDGERSDNIYVVADSSKIARCAWCGAIESENWIAGNWSLFCSEGCSLAAGAPIAVSVFILFAFASLLSRALWPMDGSVFLVPLMLGLPFLCCSLPGLNHRRSVPKDSRANEIPLDTALLTTVATSVVCPRCDAELDVRSIGKDRVYACGYCGATGTINIVNKSQ